MSSVQRTRTNQSTVIMRPFVQNNPSIINSKVFYPMCKRIIGQFSTLTVVPVKICDFDLASGLKEVRELRNKIGSAGSSFQSGGKSFESAIGHHDFQPFNPGVGGNMEGYILRHDSEKYTFADPLFLPSTCPFYFFWSGGDSGIHMGRVDEDFSVTTPELLTPGIFFGDLCLYLRLIQFQSC